MISPLKHANSGKIKPGAPLPLAPALCPPSYLSIHCYGRLILLCLPTAEQRQVLQVPVRRLCQARLPRPVGKSLHHLQIQQPGLEHHNKLTAVSGFPRTPKEKVQAEQKCHFLASISIAYKCQPTAPVFNRQRSSSAYKTLRCLWRRWKGSSSARYPWGGKKTKLGFG